MSYCTVDFRMNWMDRFGSCLNLAVFFFVCGRYARDGRGGGGGGREGGPIAVFLMPTPPPPHFSLDRL